MKLAERVTDSVAFGIALLYGSNYSIEAPTCEVVYV